MYKNRIISGHNLEVMNHMPGESIDLIGGSPPYNFGISYDIFCDNKSWEEYYSDREKEFEAFYILLKDGGRFWLNIQSDFLKKEPTSAKLVNLALECGFRWVVSFVWDDRTASVSTLGGRIENLNLKFTPMVEDIMFLVRVQ